MEENTIVDKIDADNVTSKQKEEIARKRNEDGIHRENMIIEDNHIIDVVDLINDSGNSAIAIRIKTLLENGITEEMLEAKYMDISSGVSDKNIALGNLMSVCDMFIKYLSDIPNGIVINPLTGEVDREKSIKSAYECGILSDSDVIIVNPIEKAFGIKKDPTITELLDKTFFSQEEIELSYWNYNREFGEDVGRRIDRNTFDNFFVGIAKKRGMSSEQINDELDKLHYFDINNLTVEELDFFMKIDFFAKKDTHMRPELLNKVLGKYQNLKFYKDITNQDGEIDIEKMKNFIPIAINATNKNTLLNDLNIYSNLKGKISIKDLDDVNKANLFVVLARGVLTEDDDCKYAFEELCEKLEIASNKEDIMKLIGVNSEHRLKEIATEGEVTPQNFRKVLSDLKIYKQMTPAEKMIYEVTENRNLHIADEREAIARLYMMYCEKVKEYDLYSMEGNTCKEISKAIEHYMLDKKEYFSEYLTFTKDVGVINHRVTYDRIKKVIGDKEPSKKTQLIMKSTPKQIERTLESLKDEDSKISQEEFDKFFLERSEDLAIEYEQEAEKRKNDKDTKRVLFENEDKRDIEKLKLYRADTIDDLNFAQIALFYSNKSYKITPEDVNDRLFAYRNSKYYGFLADENGKIDIDKLKEFSKNWIEEFNINELRNDTVKYLTLTKKTKVTIEDLDDVNRKNLNGILARGFLSKDENNKKAFERLCENLGIGNDLKSILKVTGCSDLDELQEVKEDQELNSLNYREKISQNRLDKQMSLGEKMIFEIGEQLDLYNPENRESIARAYVMYFEKSKQMDESLPESKTCLEIATALEHFMKDNSEKFSEYITTIRNGNTDIKNKLEYPYVKNVLKEKKQTPKTTSLTQKIVTRIDKNLNEIRDENGNITKEKNLEYFQRSEEIADAFRKESLQNLKQRNLKNVKKQKDLKEKKENPVVSWIKKTATGVRDSFKKILSRVNANQLESKETKLLEEPKEKINASKDETKRSFVETVDIDHQKAFEEMNKSIEEARTTDEQRDI